MQNSKIQWTDHTWNVARGCTKLDEDCKYCYMYRDGFRYKYDAKKVVRTKSVFNLPLRIKEPSRIFTSSLTDVFIEDIDGYRGEMWDIIRRCPQHTFQILTKRPERIVENLPMFWNDIKHHVWLGTSVGSQAGESRALELVKLRPIADTLFLSLEPLHGPLNFRWAYWNTNSKNQALTTNQHELLKNMDWVIVGGESGNESGKYRYRPCKIAWIQTLIDHCKEAGTPIFVKQLGTHLAKELKLSDRHGGDMSEWPSELQIRQFPWTN